jgi:2-phosphoglycerate kinase
MKRRELKVLHGELKRTFSSGAIVEALQGAGVPTDAAILLARGFEKTLKNRDDKTIELSELMTRLVALVAKEIGSVEAARLKRQTPPFVPLMVRGKAKGETTPFSKRTLAASLEKIDLSFKDAYSVARHVEGRLRLGGYETIGERELMHVTALSLEALLGRDQRLKYEAELEAPTDILIREASGSKMPYSRGILAQSLMALGLGPQLSHGVAKRAEEVLWRLGTREVPRPQLRRVVRGLLVQEAGIDFARRYELLRSVRRPHKPIVVMIGGVSGVGKSTLATELAYRLGISRIVSSDSVRQALRSLISEELSPALHASSFSAWRTELLPGETSTAAPKRKRVVRGFQMQVQQLNTALSAIIDRNVEEQTSVVMEGIHIVPGFMSGARTDGATVVELVLAVGDAELHRGRFEKRDAETRQHRPMNKYLEHFAEIRMLQDFIKKRAGEEGMSVLEGGDLDAAVEQAIDIILEAVLHDLPEGEPVALEAGDPGSDPGSDPDADGAAGVAAGADAETLKAS